MFVEFECFKAQVQVADPEIFLQMYGSVHHVPVDLIYSRRLAQTAHQTKIPIDPYSRFKKSSIMFALSRVLGLITHVKKKVDLNFDSLGGTVGSKFWTIVSLGLLSISPFALWRS